MKIMIAGDWHSDIHETAVAEAFAHLGHNCVSFPWFRYFEASSACLRFVNRIQNRMMAGPGVNRINDDFLRVACSSKPDIIFVYRGTHITWDTLRVLKQRLPKTVLVGYNNDDPFAPGQRTFFWRHFLKGIPLYDLLLAYRHHNIEDFMRAGAQRVELLRSWYLPERNFPCSLTAEEAAFFGCDVVFAGHYEADGREKLVERLVREGINIRLYGPEWAAIVENSATLRKLAPVVPVRGKEYNLALCGAKIGLCFLSKLNRDTYTRRCFEIPATGTFMLSEYSDDLSQLFREGVEAEFFRSEEELVYKIRKYLTADAARLAIAKAGLERVKADGHDVVSRMRDVLEWVSAIKH